MIRTFLRAIALLARARRLRDRHDALLCLCAARPEVMPERLARRHRAISGRARRLLERLPSPMRRLAKAMGGWE